MSRMTEPHPPGSGTPWQLGVYLAGLWLILGLAMPSAGLVALPVQFFLLAVGRVPDADEGCL